MTTKTFKEIDPRLDELEKAIYHGPSTQDYESNIAEYIGLIITLTDEEKFSIIHAAFIITDVLLKYDDNHTFETIFDISGQLEIADVPVNNWSEKKIVDEWNALKSRFNLIIEKSKNPMNLMYVAKNPDLFTYPIQSKTGEKLAFRPLLSTDVELLTAFLESLSLETRVLSTFDSYDKKMAQELCDAIAKYDKLRFVLENSSGDIVGLFEMTMDIPENVVESYRSYGVELDVPKTCRFGPTLADVYQSQGLGSAVFSHIIKVAKKFGKKYIMLYGGVLADNARAVHYYKKLGFKEAGRFIDDNGKEEVDMMLELPHFNS